MGSVAARIFRGAKPARCFALCFDIKCSRNKDNDFTWKDFQARNNNELVRFTEFHYRVVLTNKYYNGIVQPNELSKWMKTLTELKAYPAVISSSVERYRFREALVS
jgi:methionyl-tRNA synthetase